MTEHISSAQTFSEKKIGGICVLQIFVCSIPELFYEFLSQGLKIFVIIVFLCSCIAVSGLSGGCGSNKVQ